MNKQFASVADTEAKDISFTQVARDCYAFTAGGDPNTGVIVGDDSVLVIDAQPTPAMAALVKEKIRSVTNKPIKHVVLTHYHATRALGASSYGAGEIICSDLTRRLMEERGQDDWASEVGRFPRLFAGADEIEHLVWPTQSFASSLSLFLGRREVRIMHLGRGHTMGDVIVWVPDAGVIYSGDLVEVDTASYCGDGHLNDWTKTLDRISAFRPKVLVPGRGPVLMGEEHTALGIAATRDFIVTLRDTVSECVAQGFDLKSTFAAVRQAMDPYFLGLGLYEHRLPFNVTRAYQEMSGINHPRIWTEQRDRDIWAMLQGEPAEAALASAPHMEAGPSMSPQEIPDLVQPEQVDGAVPSDPNHLASDEGATAIEEIQATAGKVAEPAE